MLSSTCQVNVVMVLHHSYLNEERDVAGSYIILEGMKS